MSKPDELQPKRKGRLAANGAALDHRGFGDVDTLTVREFLALSRWRQLMYRLYRNPIVMFGVGPMYLFVLQHRGRWD
jgi:omega-6 fatty acid desaturase (delta-12 desaturase)